MKPIWKCRGRETVTLRQQLVWPFAFEKPGRETKSKERRLSNLAEQQEGKTKENFPRVCTP